MFEHAFPFLFFAAALQGILLAGVLGWHKRNMQANHILALWVALLSVDLLGQVYYTEKLYVDFPHLIGLTNFLPLSYGGFLYLYVRSLIYGTPLKAKDAVHFLGAFIALGLSLSAILQSGSHKLQLMDAILTDNAPWYLCWNDSGLMPLYATAYSIYTGIIFWRYQQQADNKMPKLVWLQILLGINLLIWLVVWICTFIPAFFMVADNQAIYLLVSLFIYLLGYFSLRQPDIFAEPRESTSNQFKDTGPKYGENRLPDDLREQILAVLEQHMREQTPWRSSNLTLAQLAESTGLASHHISQVLNDHHGQSFNEYLNQYRVNALCQMLCEPHNQNLLDLALSCGFSSKSSFNAIFKKQTGKTPSEYRKYVQA